MAELYKTYAETADKGVDTFIKAAKTLGEEGLWIALEIDLFLVTGEVRGDNEILWAQRKAINDLWKQNGFLALMSGDFKLPFTDIGLPNPLKPFIGLLFAYGPRLNTKKRVYSEEYGRDIEAFVALEPLDRAFIALVLPGIARLLLKFMGDILDLG